MSPTTRARAFDLLKLAVLLVGAGVAWATLTATVNQKLDAARFVADSIRREGDHELLQRIDDRVSALYCRTIPVQQQPGCR